jgi:quercetin dioxygenase-like cupin family protein
MATTETWEQNILRRHEQSAVFGEKRVLKKEEQVWAVNIQAKQAPLVDEYTGLTARTFAMFLSEYPPGGKSGRHSHTFEAAAYVLEGRGYDIHDGVRHDWAEGDTFYIPPGVVHQHFNADPERIARVLLVTNWPLLQHLGLSEMTQLATLEDVGRESD